MALVGKVAIVTGGGIGLGAAVRGVVGDPLEEAAGRDGQRRTAVA